MSETPIDSATTYLLSGATVGVASQVDQRFSYLLYVPKRREGDPARYPLVVMQHGTGRTATRYRDAMIEFAEQERVVILAPYFPAGIIDPDDLHNFKFLEYQGIRFDLILLGMVDEVAQKIPIEAEKFLLHGFSGGGQFAHRFLYAHPERLLAVSIGAPGRMTLLDETTKWWLGTKDFAEIFGSAPDVEAIRNVEIQLVVGDQDTEGWEINNKGDSNWVPGLEKQGATRIDRIKTLQQNFLDHGIKTQFDIVPGVAHEGTKVLGQVSEFFRDVLRSSRR
jgi:predicted peptidase